MPTLEIRISNVGFEVLTPVFMKSTIFWDITPYSPLKVNRRFGETFRLHFKRPISGAKYQQESRWKIGLLHTFSLVSCSACSTLKIVTAH
jgi:hypothetical protein